jgi:hypothetical protein
VWRAVRAAGEDSDQLDFLDWGDVHFLISATHQTSVALDRLPGGPKLPKRLKDHIHLMRHTVEHWSDHDCKSSWRTLVLKHAPGSNLLSLDELEQALTRVRDALLEAFPAKPKLLKVVPLHTAADGVGRHGAGGIARLAGDAQAARRAVGADRPEAVSSAWSRLLELNREAPRTVPEPGQPKSDVPG